MAIDRCSHYHHRQREHAGRPPKSARLIEVETMTESLENATEAELLRALLAARDMPCPVCAYNLRRITSANCPECGAQLDLRVASTDLKLGPWLVALFGLAMPAGFVAVYASSQLFFLGLSAIGRVRFGLNVGIMIGVPIAITGAYAFCLWRLIRRRQKFWSSPRRAQRRSALLYAVLGPGALVIGYLLVVLITFI